MFLKRLTTADMCLLPWKPHAPLPHGTRKSSTQQMRKFPTEKQDTEVLRPLHLSPVAAFLMWPIFHKILLNILLGHSSAKENGISDPHQA